MPTGRAVTGAQPALQPIKTEGMAKTLQQIAELQVLRCKTPRKLKVLAMAFISEPKKNKQAPEINVSSGNHSTAGPKSSVSPGGRPQGVWGAVLLQTKSRRQKKIRNEAKMDSKPLS